MVELTPINATSLGDHRFDGKLDDVSAKGYAAVSRSHTSCSAKRKVSPLQRCHARTR